MGKHESTAKIKVWPVLAAKVAPYRKSLYPLGAAVAGLAVACLPFTDGGSTVTNAEWSAFGAAIAAAGVTWLAPRNKPKRRPGDAGREAVERARGNDLAYDSTLDVDWKR
jgi:hypothetical protein